MSHGLARRPRPRYEVGAGRWEATTVFPADEKLDIRCTAAARLLGETGAAAGGSGTVPRVAPDGRFAALRAPAGPAEPRPAVPAHPSWIAATMAALPDPVARTFLDRIGPRAARGVLAELGRERAARLRTGPVAPPGELLAALLGRHAPPVFPPPPAWAAPLGVPDALARAAALDPDWPATPARWAASELQAAAAARAAAARDAEAATCPWPGAEAACGLARLAFALFDRPDEVWGLAGAWPRAGGLALLAAWNAWPDLGALAADARAARAAAARRVQDRWSSWAG
jgi:hypothetical protein